MRRAFGPFGNVLVTVPIPTAKQVLPRLNEQYQGLSAVYNQQTEHRVVSSCENSGSQMNAVSFRKHWKCLSTHPCGRQQLTRISNASTQGSEYVHTSYNVSCWMDTSDLHTCVCSIS